MREHLAGCCRSPVPDLERPRRFSRSSTPRPRTAHRAGLSNAIQSHCCASVTTSSSLRRVQLDALARYADRSGRPAAASSVHDVAHAADTDPKRQLRANSPMVPRSARARAPPPTARHATALNRNRSNNSHIRGRRVLAILGHAHTSGGRRGVGVQLQHCQLRLFVTRSAPWRSLPRSIKHTALEQSWTGRRSQPQRRNPAR